MKGGENKGDRTNTILVSFLLQHGDPGYLLRVDTFEEERAAIDRIEDQHRRYRVEPSIRNIESKILVGTKINTVEQHRYV